MNSYNRKSLLRALENQIRRLTHKVEVLDQLDERLSFIRLLAFVGGLIVIYGIGQWGNEFFFWFSIIAFIGGFAWLIRYHRKLDRIKEKFAVWKSMRRGQLARQQLDWANIPEKKPSQNYTNHPFATDLNLVGSHSLLQLIDTSSYQGSVDQLSEYLLTRSPQVQDIEQRQKIVAELKENEQFRDQLYLKAALNNPKKLEEEWSVKTLLKYLQESEEVDYSVSLLILGSLSLANITLGLLYFLGFIDPYIIFTLILYLVIYNFNSGKVAGLYDEASQLKNLLSPFSKILFFLETRNYKSKSALKRFCRPFWEAGYSPSRYLKSIVRIASAASSQQSELVWVLANLLMPWDLYFAQKLSTYKQELAPKLSEWITHFYKLEAYCSMADFGWRNPHYYFPVPKSDAESIFQASALGHPLIPEAEKVVNDVSINKKGDILLITGSNMAGKSTFLRTMGINLVLCFAGAPVNAKSLTTIPFRIFSSINVSDSLDNGLSHFYAEVKHLKKLLTLLEDNHKTPLFFMVDEIYRGTNNRERLQGSEAFLQKVGGKNGVGLISTHDLELAQLEESIPELSNWHFEETIEDGKMSFEFKLKPGPCPTTNALKIMDMEGLPT